MTERDKHGDISKDNVKHLIVSDTCAISGTLISDGVVPFNSVSPDRLKALVKYHKQHSVRMCYVELHEKDYDISDVERLSIIKTCDAFPESTINPFSAQKERNQFQTSA